MPKEPPGANHTFGDLLRRHREAAGLSQEALAERAGLSPRGLLYLERGGRRPYPATLRRLADALGLTAEERETLTQTAFAPATTPPRHELPAPSSSFFGRERVQARVRDLLMSHRLVTLVGPGGVGKTRLALVVADEILGHYPDGVWLIELAPLHDPGLVPSTIAQVLQLRDEPGRSVLDSLCVYCAGKSMLLVLDNCEHVLPACTTLAGSLLRAAPGLRILATSREALNVSGELRYQVLPLSIPDSEHSSSPELASGYEAVRLFVARAQERRDTFALTAANARTVAEICARLDGLPLAIELAAARVTAMSVEMIAAHLDESFRLLATSSNDLPPRQRTLRATLDWSWDLLSPSERSLLARLSVFAGGWVPEAAAAVCADQNLDFWGVVDALDGLVNRSLVALDESPEGTVRYRLLETVRQYAAERLAAAGEEEPTGNRSLDYFLSLAEQAMKGFFGPELGTWKDRLETEHANLRASLGWARARALGEEGLRLAAAVAPYWEIRGRIAEGRHVLEEMLATFQGSPGIRARALNAAGFLAMRQGDYRAALGRYQQSLALRRELGDIHGIAASLTNIGNTYIELGEYQQAEDAYAEAMQHFRTLNDRAGIATASNNQAVAMRELGRYERAESLAKESLALRREQGDLRGVAEATNNLAQVASMQGRHEQAAMLFKEGLRQSAELGDMIRLLEALEGVAWMAAELGQPTMAARAGGAAEAERERVGLPRGAPDRSFYERGVGSMRAVLGEEALAAAWAEGKAMALDEVIALALDYQPIG